MGWQDRPYYRDRGDTRSNPLMWLAGSIPLFTAFGIRVRAHASLLVCIVVVLIFGLGQGWTWQDRIIAMALLFAVVLIHEFGHCFAARAVGGSAEDILMTPLGGLAFANAPHRWGPTFITVAAGPAVNVVICVGCAALLWAMSVPLPWNPIAMASYGFHFSWFDPIRYAYQLYFISWSLLLFNLLPIYPLDGGQMVHGLLWSRIGYYRATMITCMVGMIASGVMILVFLPTGQIFLAVIFASCFFNSFRMRKMIMDIGPEEYADQTDYSAAYEPQTPKRHRRRLSQRAMQKARKVQTDARLEQELIDQILAKVSAQGMSSLTWSERRALRRATENRRKRDLELSK